MKWRKELNNNITTLQELSKFVNYNSREYSLIKKVIERHPISISRHYMSLIDFDDPNDPLKKMIIPSLNELDIKGSYDTSGEKSNTKFLGFQHKYPQTALILATNKCGSYCRFCFRKRLVGVSEDEILNNIFHAYEYIMQHKEINNILLTGGDPLTMNTAVIRKMLEKLSNIPHLDFIRFGSKMPVFLPDRFLTDPELLKMLKDFSLNKKRIYFVIQIDHPREITPQLQEVVNQLQNADIITSNQTVLLKGVNDNPQVMADLQNKLVAVGITPYYVFQCRPVKRVKKNFQIPLYDGYNIIEESKKLLNGHSKRFRYVMSHYTGKIEVVGLDNEYIYFKYHQAKSPRNLGRMFKRKLDKTAGWMNLR